MSLVSLILLIIGVFYVVGAVFEFPIVFEGNFKTKWIMEKIGRKNHKLLLLGIGIILVVLAVILR